MESEDHTTIGIYARRAEQDQSQDDMVGQSLFVNFSTHTDADFILLANPLTFCMNKFNSYHIYILFACQKNWTEIKAQVNTVSFVFEV